MNTRIRQRIALFDRLRELGFTLDEAEQLRRIEMTLHRWSELQCGDGNSYASWAVERDEETGKPYLVTYPHDGKPWRHRIADRETGALKRLDRIMAGHPALVYYHQTDPRGCSLYVCRKADIDGDIGSQYTRGLAVAA